MEDKFDVVVKSLNDLRAFLLSAPSLFGPEDRIRRHELPNSEVVSCVKWDEEFFISGTDILRCILYRFNALGRKMLNRAKFEEFVFSDLRSLKTNVRVRLEEGKSELLEFLHRNGCIRTKKKQRVFYWDAVPHDQLFLDSLERELRRAVVEDANYEYHRITVAVNEPALSMKYDPMVKVVHQIPKILSETMPEHLPVMCAVFGVSLNNLEPGNTNAYGSPYYTHQAMYQEVGTTFMAGPVKPQLHHSAPLPHMNVPLPQPTALLSSDGITYQPAPTNAVPFTGGLDRGESMGSSSASSSSSSSAADGKGAANWAKSNNEITQRHYAPVAGSQAMLPPLLRRMALQNAQLPSIHDALPAHARIDLPYLDDRQRQLPNLQTDLLSQQPDDPENENEKQADG